LVIGISLARQTTKSIGREARTQITAAIVKDPHFVFRNQQQSGTSAQAGLTVIFDPFRTSALYIELR
jgi:hypothetical protein